LSFVQKEFCHQHPVKERVIIQMDNRRIERHYLVNPIQFTSFNVKMTVGCIFVCETCCYGCNIFF